jgi:hypothetical protein
VPVELLAERHGYAPAFSLRLFRDSVFANSGLIGLGVGVGLFGPASYLPSFLQMVDGVSATGSGLKMLPLMDGVVVGSIGTGQLISQTGHYRIYPILGGALSAADMILLGLLDARSSCPAQSLAMAVLGLGVGLGPTRAGAGRAELRLPRATSARPPRPTTTCGRFAVRSAQRSSARSSPPAARTS